MSFEAHSLPIYLQTKENVAPRGKFRLVEHVLNLAICTAQSKATKVDVDLKQEAAVQGPSSARVAVEMSQVEGFFKSTIDSKLTNKIDEKLQSFKRKIVEE